MHKKEGMTATPGVDFLGRKKIPGKETTSAPQKKSV